MTNFNCNFIHHYTQLNDSALASSCTCARVINAPRGNSQDVIDHICANYPAYMRDDVRQQLTAGSLGAPKVDVSDGAWFMEHGVVYFHGQYLPHYVLHPRVITTGALLVIHKWYEDGFIPKGLFTMWSNINMPNYTPDYSVASHRFVRDCLAQLNTVAPSPELIASQTEFYGTMFQRCGLEMARNPSRSLWRIMCDIASKEENILKLSLDTDDNNGHFTKTQFEDPDILASSHYLFTNLHQYACQMSRDGGYDRRYFVYPLITKDEPLELWVSRISHRMRNRRHDRIRAGCRDQLESDLRQWLSTQDRLAAWFKKKGWTVVPLMAGEFLADKIPFNLKRTIICAHPGLGKSWCRTLLPAKSEKMSYTQLGHNETLVLDPKGTLLIGSSLRIVRPRPNRNRKTHLTRITVTGDEIKYSVKADRDKKKRGEILTLPFTLRRCENHTQTCPKQQPGKPPPDHYHLEMHLAADHKEIVGSVRGVFSACFPVSDSADETHTRIYPGHVIRSAFVGKTEARRRKIDAIQKSLGVIPLGASKVHATNTMLWFTMTDVADKVWSEMGKARFCGHPDLIVSKALKCMETVYRRTYRWLDGTTMTRRELGHVVGSNLTTGRARHVSDWQGEFIDRCTEQKKQLFKHPVTGDETSIQSLLREELRRILRPLIVGNDLSRASFENFVDDRNKWVTAGSPGGIRIEYDNVHGTGKHSSIPPGTANKRNVFEFITKQMFMDIQTMVPHLLATASEKYENGKARAIYGTGLCDYVMFSHVIGNIERLMPKVKWSETGQTGYSELRNALHKFDILQNPNNESSMGDYANFNLQHRHDSLSAIYSVIADLADEEGNVHPDFIRSAKWCAAAHLNQWVYMRKGPGKDDMPKPKSFTTLGRGYDEHRKDHYTIRVPNCTNAVKTTQGMFSGHRGTSFDNTILNIAYFSLAQRLVLEYYNLSPCNLHRVHTGDDIWLSNENVLWAACLYEMLIKIGMDLQPAKQLFSKRGEFLRILYTQDGAQGYLCRKLCSWVTSDISKDSTTDIVSRINDIHEMGAAAYRRGASIDMVWPLMQELVKDSAKLSCRAEYGHQKASVRLRTEGLGAAFLFGGIDYGRPGEVAATRSSLPKLPRLAAYTSDISDITPGNMSSAQASLDHERMHITEYQAGLLRAGYKDANMSKCIDARQRSNVRYEYIKSLKSYNKRLAARSVDVPSTRSEYTPMVDHSELIEYWRRTPRNTEHDAVFAKYIPDKHSILAMPEPTPISDLDRAVRSCPFGDLTTAQRLFEGESMLMMDMMLSKIENTQKRQNAVSVLRRFTDCLGDETAMMVLCGMRTDGPSVGWLLPPMMASYLSQVVVSAVLATACTMKKMKLEEWHAKVSAFTRHALGYIAKRTTWLDIAAQ